MSFSSSVCSAAKRIQKELVDVSEEPPVDCWAGPKGDNLFEWVAVLLGPQGEGGREGESGRRQGSIFVCSLGGRRRCEVMRHYDSGE